MSSSTVTWSDSVLSEDERFQNFERLYFYRLSMYSQRSETMSLSQHAAVLERLRQLKEYVIRSQSHQSQTHSQSRFNLLLNCFVLTSTTMKQNSLSHVSITTTVSTISTIHEKVKNNSLSLFKSEDDARLWILKMNDHFHLSNISDLYTQVNYARSYFHVSLR